MSEPVALMLVAILHIIPDDANPYGIVGRLVNALFSGRYLVMSHATYDFMPPETIAKLDAADGSPTKLIPRSREDFARFFDGLELLPPGHSWHIHRMSSTTPGVVDMPGGRSAPPATTRTLPGRYQSDPLPPRNDGDQSRPSVRYHPVTPILGARSGRASISDRRLSHRLTQPATAGQIHPQWTARQLWRCSRSRAADRSAWPCPPVQFRHGADVLSA